MMKSIRALSPLFAVSLLAAGCVASGPTDDDDDPTVMVEEDGEDGEDGAAAAPDVEPTELHDPSLTVEDKIMLP